MIRVVVVVVVVEGGGWREKEGTCLELPLGSRIGAIVEQLEGAVLGSAQIFTLLRSVGEKRKIDCRYIYR